MKGQELEAPATFPNLYAEISTDRLLSVFEAAPRRIGLALEGLDAAALSARPIPEKWSIQEIVCHLADSDTVGSIRFRLALAQPGATFPGYDQERFQNRVLAAFPAARVIVFGHTHRSLNLWVGDQLLFNPGSPHFSNHNSLALSIGLIHLSAEGEVKGEIIRLDTGRD